MTCILFKSNPAGSRVTVRSGGRRGRLLGQIRKTSDGFVFNERGTVTKEERKAVSGFMAPLVRR